MKRFMNKKLLVVGVAVALVLGIGGAAFAYFTSNGTGTGAAQVGTANGVQITQLAPTSSVVYDSITNPLPPDWWSLSKSTGMTAFGNEVNLATSAALSNVVVAMDSQACQSGTNTTCTTTPGATFQEPITLSIYNAASGDIPGSLITSDTETFNIPYRPSAADIASTGYCAPGTYNWSGNENTGAEWYDAADGNCYYGIDYAATFNNFSPANVTLPSTVVYGISYDETHPSGGPADSLNVLMSNEASSVTVGSDTDPGNVFVSASSPSPGNALGAPTGEITCSNVGTTFEQYSTAVSQATGCGETTSDSPPYNSINLIPAVQISTVSVGPFDLYPGGPAEPVDFSIHNPGSGPEDVHSVTFSTADTYNAGAGGWCDASWFTLVQPSIPINVTLSAGQTIDYQPSGASISMIDEPYPQDTCQGVTMPLNFKSS